MDRGAGQATVHGTATVGHDLVLFFFVIVCIVNSNLRFICAPLSPLVTMSLFSASVTHFCFVKTICSIFFF